MKPKMFNRLLAALALTVVASLPAQATPVIDFNNVDTTFAPFAPLLSHRDAITQGDYFVQMFSTKAGAALGDLVGSLVDGTDSQGACVGLICPSNGTQFLAALNDGLPDIGRLDGAYFQLRSFDASFIAASGNVVLGTSLRLNVEGYDGLTLLYTDSFFLPGPVNGGYSFSTYNLNSLFASTWVTDFVIRSFACTTATACTRSLDQAQFALDNITFVPEPGSFALVGLALAGLAAVRRRRVAQV